MNITRLRCAQVAKDRFRGDWTVTYFHEGQRLYAIGWNSHREALGAALQWVKLA